MPTSTTAHQWTFFRAGGFDQVSLTSAADVAAIGQLDQKLWAALACPVKGLEFDERTLALLDTDKDGRVRAPEVIAAVDYVKRNLKDVGSILAGKDRLALAAINDATPEGQLMLSCARHILKTEDKGEATDVGLDDIAKAREAFSKTPFNGDGIITAEAGEDDATRSAIGDIIAVMGAVTDRTGKPGIDKAKLDAFAAEAKAYSDWRAEAERDATLQPLGAQTLEAVAAYETVKPKIEDYFARCRLAAYDPRCQLALNRQEKDYLAVASRDLALTDEEIRRFPLATVEPGKPLPLEGALNPAWSAAVADFRRRVAEPVLGGAEAKDLDEAEWARIDAVIAPARAYIARKKGAAAEKLGLERVRALLDPAVLARIRALIERDLAFQKEFDAIEPVERLVRYHRDLYRMLHNFINFADFFSRDRMAIFQVGVLYLDSRATELVVRVDDMGRHGALAGLSKTYLAYCDCTRPGEKMTIAAAFTAGDSDNLLVGRNGVFYDRRGRDWDATIVKVVENPISIRQAFWAPYKRAIRFVEEMVAKRAAAAEAASDAKLSGAVNETARAAETGKGPAQKPKLDLTLVTGIGVAVGGIAGAFSAFFAAFFGLGAWMPLGFLGLILAISLPSMIIAALKLRQRNLGPILDANGWAVNGRVKINIPFGGSLTELARLPQNAVRSLSDPYAEKKTPWKAYTLLALVLLAGLALAWHRVHAGRWLWEPAVAVVVDLAAHDTGKDGALSKEEIAAITDGAQRAAVLKLDTDGDGAVSADEAKGAAAPAVPAEAPKAP